MTRVAMKLDKHLYRLLTPWAFNVKPSRYASSGPVDLAFKKYDRETVASEARPPLVILHGLFGHKQNWHSVAKALNRRLGCTVFAVDLRNHGNLAVRSLFECKVCKIDEVYTA